MANQIPYSVMCPNTTSPHFFTKIYYTHFQLLRFMINVLKDDLQVLLSSPFIAIGLDDSKDQAFEEHWLLLGKYPIFVIWKKKVIGS